jgi:tRNA-binding EMAP/Myf-like protein
VSDTIEFGDFLAVDMRVGRVVAVDELPDTDVPLGARVLMPRGS